MRAAAVQVWKKKNISILEKHIPPETFRFKLQFPRLSVEMISPIITGGRIKFQSARKFRRDRRDN